MGNSVDFVDYTIQVRGYIVFLLLFLELNLTFIKVLTYCALNFVIKWQEFLNLGNLS